MFLFFNVFLFLNILLLFNLLRKKYILRVLIGSWTVWTPPYVDGQYGLLAMIYA